MRFVILQVFLFCTGLAQAQQYVISTLAGGAALPTPISAVNASIGDPPRVAVDAAGNLYFGGLHSVFKVDTSGNLTRIAGNGQYFDLRRTGHGGIHRRWRRRYPSATERSDGPGARFRGQPLHR